MTHSLLYPLTVQSNSPLTLDHLINYCQGVIEALRQASEMMGESTPNLF